jgi:hypothetical protein
MKRALVLALSAGLVAVSCGGEPPAKAPEAAGEQASPTVPAMKTVSELGDVDPVAVRTSFGALDGRFASCQERGLARVEVLAGTVKFFVRIGADGRAKWAYLEESDVGDRNTEKCLLGTVIDARWPKPNGGDAEIRHTMELPLQATRPPNDWPADKVAEALGHHGEAIDRCKGGSSARFHATMYVAPGGNVLAAGVATSTKEGEDRADCLAKVLATMKGLPSPGSWPAKVSFGL